MSMKRLFPRLENALLILAGLLWLAGSSSLRAEDPYIESVRLEDRDVLVFVKIPAGVTKVTLESRTRVLAGAWTPVAVQRAGGRAGTLTFRLRRSVNLEMLRIRTDTSEPLPAFFYQGTNTFTGSPGASVGAEYTYLRDATSTTPSANGSSETATRTVVESDIWNITGKTLYFFNQYRGLQVLDLANPNVPVLQGTLKLPAAGEQMYVLRDGMVILLARDSCNYYGAGSESRVLLVGVTNGVPGVAASLPVSGYIQESRLVGTALYVASQTYRQTTTTPDPKGGAEPVTSTVWEWGTVVTSFDLADPYQPVAKSRLWFAGWGNVVSATDRFLFVVNNDTANYYASNIRCVDISDPAGTMKELATIRTAGQVPDKFKMNVNGEVFTAISQAWDATRRWVTTLETFSLAIPTAPQKLGKLELAAGEQLHATRFDGDKVYVVTFFRVDPLWVVDLSNPAKPQIKGELQVPGWSTYIQPLGNRLVTIGIDNSNSWRTAVSLFDVTDPAKPSLVSKVPLGESYSWSEANYDEKAFSVLPESGLVLVPYQGYSSNGYASRVQLIDLSLEDLSTNALKARGTIEHQFQPRRATVFEKNILSVSGKELLSVDAADRDRPLVRSTLELAWPVSKLAVQGDYVIEVADGNSSWWYNGDQKPILRVVSSQDTSSVLGELALENGLPIIGATSAPGRLYLAQGGGQYFPYYLSNGPGGQTDTNPPPLVLTVVDLSQLPKLSILGQESVPQTNNLWVSSLQAVWPKPGVLTFSGGGGGYRFWGPMLDVVGGIGGRGFYYPWYGGGGSGQFFTFDVTAAKPKFLSQLDLTTNNWWSFSQAFTAEGLIYVSHQASEFLEGVKSAYQTTVADTKVDPETGKIITNSVVTGTWVTKYYLDVVDFSDPAAPTPRKPVNIPGVLKGLSHQGALVYTMGPHWAPDMTTDWSEWLDAGAYNGVAVSLVGSLALPKEYPHPLWMAEGLAIVGRPSTTTEKLSSVETWKMADTGKFTQLGAWFQASQANDFRTFGGLLAVQNTDSSYRLLDWSNPAALKLIGGNESEGCIWGSFGDSAGDLARGLWVPASDYGVLFVPVNK